MANLILADGNLIQDATLETDDWTVSAPVSNCQTLPLGIAAISEGPGTAEAPLVIEGVLPFRDPVTYAGLFKTNLNQRETVRLQLFSADDLTGSIYDSRDPVTGLDQRVIPPLYDWRQLRFGAPNLLRGDLAPKDFALYPTNVHFKVPLCRPLSFRLSIVGTGYLRTTDPETDGTAAGFISIGHFWLSDSIEIEYPTPVGGHRRWKPGDDIVQTPGGGVFVEPGTGRRTASIGLDVISPADTDRLTDLAVRLGLDRPAVVLPDLDDPADTFRYGFIAQRRGDFDKTQRFLDGDQATLDWEEITT